MLKVKLSIAYKLNDIGADVVGLLYEVELIRSELDEELGGAGLAWYRWLLGVWRLGVRRWRPDGPFCAGFLLDNFFILNDIPMRSHEQEILLVAL